MTENQVQALKVHVAIHVRDTARSIEFYRKMFGIEPSKVREGYAKFDVANPPGLTIQNQDAILRRFKAAPVPKF